MKDIKLTQFPDVSGPLWYLDAINDSKLLYVSGAIKAIEWTYNVNRIRAPHIVECCESEMQMKREHSSGDVSYWRLVNDLFLDSIEVAARHVINTYKQLPYALSAEDSIYYVSPRGLERKYVWTVAVYGGEVEAITGAASLLCENHEPIDIRIEDSAIEVCGKDNKLFRPKVAVMNVTLIDGQTDIRFANK